MPAAAQEPKQATTPETKPAAEKPKEPGVAASTFIERMAGGLKKKPAPVAEKPKEEPAKKEEAAKSKEEPKAKEEPKVEPKKKPEAIIPPAPNVDPEAIAEAAGRGAAAAIAKSREADKPKEPKVTDGLTDDESETYEVLARMEKDFGTQYSGRSAKYADSLKKAKKYQADWETVNPGRQFDAEAAEHNEFFEANDVDWNDTHFNRTLARIEAEKMVAKDREKGNKELDELKRKEQLREEEPKITAKKRANAKTFFGAMGAEFDKVISDDGRVDVAEVKRILEADPIKAVAFDSAESVEAFTSELYRLTNGLSEYDDKNPSHNFIGKFVEQQEVLLKSLPADQQLDEQGRRFATSEEYAQMTPGKRAYYWRLGMDDVAAMYSANEAKMAQDRIKAEETRIEKIAAARGYVKKEAQQQAPPTNGEKPKVEVALVVEKPVSPSGAIEPRTALTPPAGGQNKVSTFTQRWLGRG